MANGASAERITPEDIIEMVNELPALAREEFMEGLVKHSWLVEQSQSPEATSGLATYLHSWIVSMRLQRNEAWRRQVDAAERRIAAGETEPESIDDFDARLAEQRRLVS